MRNWGIIEKGTLARPDGSGKGSFRLWKNFNKKIGYCIIRHEK